jgi:hypothetical protein
VSIHGISSAFTGIGPAKDSGAKCAMHVTISISCSAVIAMSMSAKRAVVIGSEQGCETE